ncbi:hypothetical protein PYCH_15310 [Pyrococcus yayanosii CH1]|uniref:Uncharacterized protein n=1 Tax=Pyrococcus yayanosii (strain CH1 / JCM 16557) TaxID=529709 RepID=F8AGR1_PYRYC|nr:hypothetical protein PYCH_15310 [Pyrococcus yayanosii CH1]
MEEKKTILILSELFNIIPDSPQNFLREAKEEIGRENSKATKNQEKDNR